MQKIKLISLSFSLPFLAPLLLFLLHGSLSAAVTFQFFRFEPLQLRGEGSENSIQLAEIDRKSVV